MTIVSVLADDGAEEPLPEAADAFDRFLASLYRALHPTTRAWLDHHHSKEQQALYRTAPHRALYRAAVALRTTGLLAHGVRRAWPLVVWARELALDAAALAAAPAAFLGAFVCGHAAPLESFALVQAEHKRKLTPAQPSWTNVMVYFVVPASILWFGRDLVRLLLHRTVVAKEVTNELASVLLAAVGAYQGVWSALRLKQAQHAAFFGDEGRRNLEFVQELASDVARLQNVRVTARTRRRGVVLLNLSVSTLLVWNHFFWSRRTTAGLAASAALFAISFVPVAAFHLKHGFVS